MKCWECKKIVNRATRLHYYDGVAEKGRDVCPECIEKITFDPCHFVRVERITQRQLKKG